MKSECRGYRYYVTFLSVFLLALLALNGCTNPEKAKAEHVSKGEAYLKDSKYQEASLEFRNAIQIDDKFAAAHWGLARAYEGLGRGVEMIEELRKTCQLDQNNFDARVKLGTYYIAYGAGKPENIAEADRLADEILKKDPNHIEGHILKGTALFAQNTPETKEKAFAELQKAISLDPNRVESYLSLAKFYVASGKTQDAEDTFHKAISIGPNNPSAHVEYGRFLVQTNRSPQAEAEFLKAVEVGPTDHSARLVLASYFLVNKQFDKAEAQYKALADMDKDKPEGPTILADYYSTVNRVDDAIRIYKEVLAKSPDFMQGRYRLTEILMQKGDMQGATEQVEEALKRDSHDRQALLLRARIRSQSGGTDGQKAALEDLKEVLKQEPNSKLGLYFMAQTNFNLGLQDQARSFANDLTKAYPDYLPGKLMEVQISLAAGDPKSAVTTATDLLDRLSKAIPDREVSSQLMEEIKEKAYLARGTAQIRLQNFPGARADFEAAKKDFPNDPNVYNNLALLAMSESKLEDANSNFEQTLKLDQTNFVALAGLLNIYLGAKDYDKAHGRVDQALAASPNSAQLHYLKAQIYGAQHNNQGAETELNKSLEIDPGYIPGYSALGALYINSKQEDRAIAQYRKLLEKRPDSAMAYTLIGMLEDGRKNYDAAVDNYKKALALDQNSAIAGNNLAWLYAVYNKGNLDEAVKLAQAVVQKNPGIPGFLDTLGWVYYKKNLYAAAVEQLQKAVDQEEVSAKSTNRPPSASYHYHLGMALKAKGDKVGSKRELETALRLADKNPFADSDEARKALASL